MLRRRERLQKKHPEVRHEVPRDAVIRVVKKDFQTFFSNTTLVAVNGK